MLPFLNFKLGGKVLHKNEKLEKEIELGKRKSKVLGELRRLGQSVFVGYDLRRMFFVDGCPLAHSNVICHSLGAGIFRIYYP